MKKLLILIMVLAIMVALVATFANMVKEETLKIIFQRVFVVALGSGAALLAHAGMQMAKKDVFGQWMVRICIDSKHMEDEDENLNSEDAEKMITYDRPWWIVFFFGGNPSLRKDLHVEQLLRRCCESIGRIKGDIRNYVTVDKRRRFININLKEEYIQL
jgi:hypothetical protein